MSTKVLAMSPDGMSRAACGRHAAKLHAESRAAVNPCAREILEDAAHAHEVCASQGSRPRLTAAEVAAMEKFPGG